MFNGINKLKENDHLQVMDMTYTELEKRKSKSPIDEGTRSTSSHSEIEKMTKQKKNVVTSKNYTKEVKQK